MDREVVRSDDPQICTCILLLYKSPTEMVMAFSLGSAIGKFCFSFQLCCLRAVNL